MIDLGPEKPPEDIRSPSPGLFGIFNARPTIMGQYSSPQAHGFHIVGKSRKIIEKGYTVGSNQAMLKAAINVNNGKTAVDFFRRYGPIWQNDCVLSESLLAWELDKTLNTFSGLRRIADLYASAPANDHASALENIGPYLSNGHVAARVSIFVSLVKGVPTENLLMDRMYSFLIFEMLSDVKILSMGTEKHNSCLRCGASFTSDGFRGTESKRLDAKYCSKTCQKAAHYERRRKLTCNRV